MVSVSVAMATYNGEAFILQQLESFAQQSLLPTELVVTDDGSTDGTLEIIESFAATAAFPVRVTRNPQRLGYRANFMSNFARCTSDLIAVSDQDDLWDSRKLQLAVEAFEDDPDVVLFFHDAWLIDQSNNRLAEANIIKLAPRNPPLSFYPFINPLGFSIVFRRELLALSDEWQSSVDTWEPKHRMAHDQWLCFLASVYGTVAFCGEKLADYRQHASNTYGWKPQSLWAKYRYKLRNPSEAFLAHARAAAARAAILERGGDDMSPLWQERARKAAALYREVSRRLALRARIYVGNSFSERIGALRSLRREGAYHEATPWDFSWKALTKDLIFGLALRGVLTKPVRDFDNAAMRTDPQP